MWSVWYIANTPSNQTNVKAHLVLFWSAVVVLSVVTNLLVREWREAPIKVRWSREAIGVATNIRFWNRLEWQ